MSEETSKRLTKRVKRLGSTGIVIGTLSVLACELPIVLALVGLGGLSSAALVFSLPPMIEMIGITLGLLGLLLMVGFLTYRVISKVRL
jgi:hypothetical protein